MKILKNCVVTLNYTVTDVDGALVDEGKEPIMYLHGGYDGIFEKIEAAVDGKIVGDRFSVQLSPEESFGEYDDDLVEIEDKSAFPENIEIGMQFFQGDESDEEQLMYIVRDIEEDRVVLDANHPLAGITLIFAGRVDDVRLATSEEITKKVVLVQA